MNTTMIWIKILFLLALTSCGSTNVGKDKSCTIVKHQYDELYQIKINKKNISDQWFLMEDAIEIAQDLEKKKKCKYADH